MMRSRPEKLDVLEGLLERIERIAVAVSGGVDSMTLAVCAHRRLPQRVEMFHAVSPAVPQEATDRVRALAARESWALHVLDAGEFADPQYLANPLNRCFYCKSGLYSAIAPHTRAQIVSGANLDDLGEYRPGLIAARQYGVRHPFVEAGIDKQTVRAIARELELGTLAELPASPCLSSRIETGIGIDPATLELVHRVEKLVAQALQPQTVRCRVRAQGVVVELDAAGLRALGQTLRTQLTTQIAELFRAGGQARSVHFALYRVGSAFLHGSAKLSASAERAGNAVHPGEAG
jgi:pyridinium-3,5-biscarboxylic acid mononucleotide sulfurtransferase